MQLGWIDFLKEDRQKELDVINILSEKGTFDELRIGSIYCIEVGQSSYIFMYVGR